MESKGPVAVANVPPEYRLGSKPRFIQSDGTGLTKIYDFLYLGSWRNVTEIGKLKKFGITGVLNAAAEYKILEQVRCRDRQSNADYEFAVCFLNLYKDKRHIPSPASEFESGIRFIDGERKKGGKVLVQCDTGIERAAAVALAYFMREEKMSYDRALAALRNRGVVIHPTSWLEDVLGDGMSDDE